MERVTSPGIYVAVVCAAIAIAIRPGWALPVLAAAETLAALACALLVRTILRRTPPAPQAAAVVFAFSIFWLTMAGLSLKWFFEW